MLKVVLCSAQHTINPLNVKLSPICHLLALLEAHHFLHVKNKYKYKNK
jgi:hypothetical protein